jgi:hypothetical protein
MTSEAMRSTGSDGSGSEPGDAGIESAKEPQEAARCSEQA